MRITRLINKIRVLFANENQYIEILRRGGVNIGENCVIDKTAEFGTEPYLITIGNHVRITKGVKFITHDGGLWVPRELGMVDKYADKFGRIKIGDNTNIGWNAIIMPGVEIGRNCIVGCGAVVTKNVPENSVVAGVPARVIETVQQYADKNKAKCVLTKNLSAFEKREYLLKQEF